MQKKIKIEEDVECLEVDQPSHSCDPESGPCADPSPTRYVGSGPAFHRPSMRGYCQCHWSSIRASRGAEERCGRALQGILGE